MIENEQQNLIRKTFNDEFLKFVNEVYVIFPNDRDIKKAKNALELLKKANPKLIIQIWYEYITKVYKSKIDAGDISFFLEKDYSKDLSDTSNSSRIMESINRLRDPINNMGETNQAISMKYIQNLTKLSEIYYN
jgi:hypothetical protein